MDKNNLYDALEEMILERINAHHLDEPESVEQAYAKLTEAMDELRGTFTERQRLIFTECEDAYGVYEGETINFYYRAGFSDAIRFLFGWTDSTQWRKFNMTIHELREKRAKAWEAAKAFLDSHRTGNGTLTAEDDTTYTRMEQEITDLGKEIARLERQEALDAELNKPVNRPITGQPMSGTAEVKTGRATDEYRTNFWNVMRTKVPQPHIVNALETGKDSEGGYLAPDEYERTLVEALEEENIFRSMAKIINTASGDRKIPMVATKGTASWIDEEGAYLESDDSFGMISIGAYKLGTMIKVSEELLNDSVFKLEDYIAKEFARRIGNKEEEAFFNGDGAGKPIGVLADNGGAQVGVTAASASAITADELMDLFYSLNAPYRRSAVWTMNDATIKGIRKLKDNSGQYLWQPSLVANTPDTLLGRPIKTSAYMPTMATTAKSIAFGDFKYYWIADRQGRCFKRLNELYATTGQIGFLGSQRVDGKLILPEAIKVLQMKGGTAEPQ